MIIYDVLQCVGTQNKLVYYLLNCETHIYWVTTIRFVQCITSLPLSRHLHWCQVHYHIQFKLCNIMNSIFDKYGLSRQLVQGATGNQRRKGLNLLLRLHALNTSCQEVAVHSVCVRFPSLPRWPVTNFRPHSVTLPTRSSSENVESQLFSGFFAIV